ncbi:NAD(P)H-flavin reductase [Rheinheimera sp. MMS21-TC3]|uniref:NAD(P)H-flavin reductase n=1 Tax=Rheinheimera sp. MMS21-TC3 TaxID=3072790 RepID=UPI0028C37E62|nr:NAD(P)H-flavin reductase [Rheinheimera sp. MMS21-TC3]WNO59740.1 NAD(P)H-flavin reductase [Rheinheimera sp. MMS21-TC3]
MTIIACTIDAIEPLTPTVNRVLLTPTTPISYQSGQYLQLCLTAEDKRPFSIASHAGSKQIELHIGASVADNFSSQALAHLQQLFAAKQPVLAEIGLGEAQLRTDSDRPLILLAGGTGFSYIYSIAQTLAKQQVNRPVFAYWGLRDQDALYHHPQMQQWASSNEHFTFIPVIQNPTTNWQGRTGLVHQAVLDDFASLAGYDIYIAGPFAMAGVVRDAFVEHGAERENMFCDAFAYI